MILGWLSPDGEMIEVDYMQHLYVAGELCKKYYGIEELYVPDEILLEHGWVHLTMTTFINYEYHVIWKYGGHLTEAQKEYLKPVILEDLNWLNKSCKMDLEEEGVI